ncbi:DegT/DnrJ/EryC1/StrS family aminotransferase, partial [Patescibacteria group bacterium]|nr:DegT/DnrJ/EryC1/StrS family aminotransferase [Patescibacteria group bacterium]
KAIIVVHTAGQVCEMDKIVALAKKHNLYLIEDSAQTIGGTWQGKEAGAFGEIGCFSFFPTKNMTTGEGGMLTTKSDKLAQKIRTLIAHGVVRRPDAQGNLTRYVEMPGYNFRMSNILAALGLEQLKRLDAMNARRWRRAEYLNRNIINPKVIKPVILDEAQAVYQMYIVRIKNNRDEVAKKLKEAGIANTVYCNPPVHLHPYYKEHYPTKNNLLPCTMKACAENLILPMYPEMTKEQTDYIIKIINNL